jgi:hypothetical protein
MNKKLIHVNIEHLDLEGSLDSVIQSLMNSRAEYQNLFSDIHIDINVEDNYGCPCVSIILQGYREENDKEYRERLEAVKAQEERKKQSEIAEFNRIKSKYNL